MALNSTRAGQPKRSFFTRFSQYIAVQAGRPVTFVGAVGLIVIWAATGPFAGFGDTWQLIINTSTTIITFLMVFVIQNSQNRDTAALHIKIDELIARTEGTRRVLLDLEELDDKAIEDIRSEYELMARHEREGGAGEDTKDEASDAEPADLMAAKERTKSKPASGPKRRTVRRKPSAGTSAGGRKAGS
ncbi:low affinity iron permease family protein [Ancylobacter sp. MQZ15Z-1]|uniref:Low affinity iron permease family protein n=1 Tax=Ancylobacter mangrovi TaxID=2972472 RepID=A0A9X2PBU3_9HYPH|nr:low affinity iron permease family protein [Ancylobacter mangrovi]MCS0494011.1 low affinity iron permease family protein [Ancylobacter mangrovi]